MATLAMAFTLSPSAVAQSEAVSAAPAENGAQADRTLDYPYIAGQSPNVFQSRGQNPNVLYNAILEYGPQLQRGEFETLENYISRKNSVSEEFLSIYGKKFIFEVEFLEFLETFKYNFDSELLTVDAFPDLVISSLFVTPSINCMFKGVVKKKPEIAKKIKFDSRHYILMDVNMSTGGVPTVDKFGWRSTYSFGLKESINMNASSSTYGAIVVSFRGLNMRLISVSKDDGSILIDLPCQ